MAEEGETVSLPMLLEAAKRGNKVFIYTFCRKIYSQNIHVLNVKVINLQEQLEEALAENASDLKLLDGTGNSALHWYFKIVYTF